MGDMPVSYLITAIREIISECKREGEREKGRARAREPYIVGVSGAPCNQFAFSLM